MYHHIGKTAAFCHLIGIDHIVAHHPAAFAHSGCCTASDHSTIFVTRQIFFQELSQEAYLLPKFKIGGENRAYRSYIHPIDLCLYPLEAVGARDAALAEAFSDDFFSVIPTKSRLMPHAYEVLEYLAEKYNLYILSNGFQELQCHKMRSAGIDRFFKKIVLSDDIGVLKPWPEIFHFALSATQSEVRDSLMIGDSWENDVAGAKGVGMHQVFYNVTGKEELPFQPTYHISNLKELMQIL